MIFHPTSDTEDDLLGDPLISLGDSHGTTQDRTPLISVALNGVWGHWGPQVIDMAVENGWISTRLVVFFAYPIWG